MKKLVLAVLAYVLPTFPLGYFWHLKTFAGYYQSLEVYRTDIIIPFGLLSYGKAALAVLLCRTLPIKYHILSTDNEDLGGGYTPEQVKRGEFTEAA